MSAKRLVASRTKAATDRSRRTSEIEVAEPRESVIGFILLLDDIRGLGGFSAAGGIAEVRERVAGMIHCGERAMAGVDKDCRTWWLRTEKPSKA
ncbi:MAG TPA: hypothetical protein VFA15_04415 [Nitrososphaera sp.]|nr:hypothetical protein [Nitrososphaera sp.]